MLSLAKDESSALWLEGVPRFKEQDMSKAVKGKAKKRAKGFIFMTS